MAFYKKSSKKQSYPLLKQQPNNSANTFCLHSAFFCFGGYDIAKTKILCSHNTLLCLCNRSYFTCKTKLTKNCSIRFKSNVGSGRLKCTGKGGINRTLCKTNSTCNIYINILVAELKAAAFFYNGGNSGNTTGVNFFAVNT